MYTYKLGGLFITDELYHDDLDVMTFGRKDQNELRHSGIKGQKWGKRRFQNEDGSLTAAGRNRYDVGDPRNGVSAYSDTGGSGGSGVSYFKSPSTSQNSGSSGGSSRTTGSTGGSASSQPFARQVSKPSTSTGGTQSVNRSVVNRANAGRKAADNLFSRVGNWAGNAANDIGRTANNAYNDASKAVGNAANAAGNWVGNAVKDVGNLLSNEDEKKAAENAQLRFERTLNSAINNSGEYVPDGKGGEDLYIRDANDAKLVDITEQQAAKAKEKYDNHLATKAQNAVNDAGNFVRDNYNRAREAVNGVASDVGNFATNAYNDASKAVGNAAKDVGNFTTNAYNDVSKAVSGAANDVGNWVGNAASDVSKWGAGALDKGRQALEGLFGGAKSAANAAGDWVGNAASDVSKWGAGALDKGRQALEGLFGGAKSAANAAGDWVGNAAKDVGNFANNAYNDASKAVGNAANAAGNWVGNAVKDVGNLLSNEDEKKAAENAQLRFERTLNSAINNSGEYVPDGKGGEDLYIRDANDAKLVDITEQQAAKAKEKYDNHLATKAQNAVNDAGNFVRDNYNRAREAVNGVASDVGNFATNAYNDASKAVGNAAKDVGNFAKNAWESPWVNPVEAGKVAGNWVGNAANDVGNWAGNAFNNAKNWVGNAAKDVGNTLGNAANSAANAVGEGATKVWNDVTGETKRQEQQKEQEYHDTLNSIGDTLRTAKTATERENALRDLISTMDNNDAFHVRSGFQNDTPMSFWAERAKNNFDKIDRLQENLDKGYYTGAEAERAKREIAEAKIDNELMIGNFYNNTNASGRWGPDGLAGNYENTPDNVSQQEWDRYVVENYGHYPNRGRRTIKHSALEDKPSGVTDSFWSDYISIGGTREKYDKALNDLANRR